MTEFGLYELLTNNYYFTHSIGMINKKETFSKFESIMNLKGLYSKEQLRRKNIIVEGMVSGNVRITKDCYISLFDPSVSSFSKKSLFSNYFPIQQNHIMFLVDSSIEQLDNVKRNDFDYSEVVVKNFLPIDYFKGVVIPSDEEVLKFVSSTMEKHDLDLPIYNYDGVLINSNRKRK